MAASVKPNEKSEALFYHSTTPLAAVCVSVEGFRILSNPLRNWAGGALGSGIYVTAALDTALMYSEIADSGITLRVRMESGTQILRLDGQYDRRVIEYLGREFSRELYSPNFVKAIPSNKRLSRVELINLVNFLWSRGAAGKPRSLQPWYEELGPLRRYLTRHQYDGLGSMDSDIGVVVFNPSRLKVDSILRLSEAGPRTDSGWKRTEPPVITDADPVFLAQTAAERLRQAIKSLRDLRKALAESEAACRTEEARYDREKLTAYLIEIPRWQRCLRAFCMRHQISTEDALLARALRELGPTRESKPQRKERTELPEPGSPSAE